MKIYKAVTALLLFAAFAYAQDEAVDEEDDDDDADVAATFGVANIFKASPKTSPSRPNSKKMVGPSQQNVDKERLTVDISALRQQYKKLRQRQTQAQIILTCKENFLDFFREIKVVNGCQ